MLRSHGVTREESLFKNKDLAYTHFDGKKLLNKWYYEMHYLSHNFRITDFQCALGISQLNKIDLLVKKRQKIASIYKKLIINEKNNYISLPSQNSKFKHAYHLFIVLINFDKLKGGRAKLMNDLEKKGIQTQVNYIPIYYQPYYQKLFKNFKSSGSKTFIINV